MVGRGGAPPARGPLKPPLAAATASLGPARARRSGWSRFGWFTRRPRSPAASRGGAGPRRKRSRRPGQECSTACAQTGAPIGRPAIFPRPGSERVLPTPGTTVNGAGARRVPWRSVASPGAHLAVGCGWASAWDEAKLRLICLLFRLQPAQPPGTPGCRTCRGRRSARRATCRR
jgi:hypothetical protein